MAAQPWGPAPNAPPPYEGQMAPMNPSFAPQPNMQKQMAPPPPTMQAMQTSTVVVMERGTGNCPNCGTGLLHPEFTCCGIALAIIFFPWGICCCFMMRENRCGSCGYAMG